MLKRVDDASEVAPVRARNAGLDVLRGAIALLVVAHHTAITYGGAGDWFYREVMPSGAASSRVLSLFCGFNQAWFMGLFFLLAGYFTPMSAARHGAPGFARERLIKLGLPLLAFGYILGPITVALARTVRGQAFGPTLLGLWEHATFVLGPPWFCWALLLFTGAFLLLRSVAAPRAPLRAFPANRTLLMAALLTGAVAFALRLAWPVGATPLGLQLGYFGSYALLFAFGCFACEARVLSRVPEHQVRLWGVVALAAFPILPIAASLGALWPMLAGSYGGGWTMPAVVYAFWEPFVAWGTILALLFVFQRRFAMPGWFADTLGRRAYAIFIIHPPVVVGVALLLRAVEAPALVKFGVVATLSCVACFLIAGLLLRVRPLARVL